MVAHPFAPGLRRVSSSVVIAATCLLAGTAAAQVFTVGEKSATADIKTDFKPTHVDLPDNRLTERGRRELMRDLADEQGFAHRTLPLGVTLTLQANGQLTPRDDQYRQVVYKKGSSAAPGDRIVITALEFKGDRIIVDLNGGPYVRHRFLRHIQIGVGGAMTQDPDLSETATGVRIALVFEGGVPELSAPEVKALLEPVIDFKVKTSELAYADTLPAELKAAIASHDVLVGMNHRMVLAALGQPETKIREGSGQERYEEWIYGHQPQTMHFVRFVGDRVSLVKIAALGKPIEVHADDEMAGYQQPATTVAVGDVPAAEGQAGPPSLKLPTEAATPVDSSIVDPQQNRKVQYPVEKTEKPAPIPPTPADSIPSSDKPAATDKSAPPPAPHFLVAGSDRVN